MSFLEIQQDISRKSLMELSCLREDYNKNIVILDLEREKLSKTLREIEKREKELHNKLKEALQEIKRRESIEEIKIINDERIKYIEGFDLLKECELSLIIKNMDKNDYREYGATRWMDLPRLIREVSTIKKQYPNWELTNLIKTGQYDTMPPNNFYKFEFKDSNDNYFTIGRICLVH